MGARASRSRNDPGKLAAACADDDLLRTFIALEMIEGETRRLTLGRAQASACHGENNHTQPADASAFQLASEEDSADCGEREWTLESGGGATGKGSEHGTANQRWRKGELHRCKSDETFTSRRSSESGASEHRRIKSKQQSNRAQEFETEDDLLRTFNALERIEGVTGRLSLSRATNAADKEDNQGLEFEVDGRKDRTNTSPSRLQRQSPSRLGRSPPHGLPSTREKRLELKSPSQLGRSLRLRSSVSPSRRSSVSGARVHRGNCVRPGYGEVYSFGIHPAERERVRILSAWSRNEDPYIRQSMKRK
jgi:hypothetical protein